jgi:hypothetical protein
MTGEADTAWVVRAVAASRRASALSIAMLTTIACGAGPTTDAAPDGAVRDATAQPDTGDATESTDVRDASTSVVWGRAVGGGWGDRGTRARMDTAENAYVSGYFSSHSVDIEGTVTKTDGDYGPFVSKFDRSGRAVWTTVFGPLAHGVDVAIAGDHLVFACYIDADTDFGLGKVKAPSLVLVALSEADGRAVWQRSFVQGTGSQGFALGLSANASGDIALTGTVHGSIFFGKTSFPCAASGDGPPCTFLVKLDALGVETWGRPIGVEPEGAIVHVDDAGSVYVAGAFVDPSLSIGGPAPLIGPEAFEAKFDAKGAHLWSLGQASGSYQNPTDLAFADGRLFVVGDFDGTIAFDVPHPSNGKEDVFLAALDANSGAPLWSRTWGGAERDALARVAAGADGVVATSDVQTATPEDDAAATVSVDGIPLHARDYNDAFFFVSFEPTTGAARWARPIGVGNGSLVASVISLPGGDNLVAGYFNKQFNFVTGPILAKGTDGIEPSVFIARYGP